MKKIYLWGFLVLLASMLQAQEPRKLVKLSNFDPSDYRSNCNDVYDLYPNAIGRWCYTDIWGYTIPSTDPSQPDREFALLAVSSSRIWDPIPLEHGLSIVEITDPLNPVEVQFVELRSASLRDFKTYTTDSNQTYLYACSDGSLVAPQMSYADVNLEIIDLTPLATNPSAVGIVAAYTDSGNLHNIFIDQEAGKLHMIYEVTSTNPGANYAILDLSNNPLSPTLEYTEHIGAVHDIYARDNFVLLAATDFHIREYDETTQSFVNANIFSFTPSQGHDTWLSQDGLKATFNDEHRDEFLHFADLFNYASTNNISVSGSIGGIGAVSRHNSQIPGNDYCYTAHYPLGLKVYDLSQVIPGDPSNSSVSEYGYYDTYRESDKNIPNFDFHGAFGVWSMFPSNRITISDMHYGLFVINECVPAQFSSGVNFTLNSINSALDADNSGKVDEKEVMGWAAEESLTLAPPANNDFIVEENGNVTLIAGKKIRIKKGFKAINQGKFHAQIGAVCNECNEGDRDCFESERAERENSLAANEEENRERFRANMKAFLAPSDYFAKMFPNPTNGDFVLEVNIATAENIKVDLLDLNGKWLQTLSDRTHFVGKNILTLSAKAIPNGLYLLRVSTPSKEEILKFSKIN